MQVSPPIDIHSSAHGEELIPAEVTYAILDGANPVRVWREQRGLTQQQLADAAGISTPYLSQIESGKRTGCPDFIGCTGQTTMAWLID